MLIKLAHWMRRLYYFVVRPVTLGVRILLVADGQVVLVKHNYERGWFLPGGGVKRGETLEQAIRREAAEECGAALNSLVFVGIYSNFVDFKSDHVSLFLCEDFTLQEVASQEIEQASSFPLDRLPKDMSPGSQRMITAYINGSLPSTGVW